MTAVSLRGDKLKGLRPFNSYRAGVNHWFNQGSDCGLYENHDVHGIRILAQEPTSQSKRRFWNWGDERYRILGEIPVRKFDREEKQPTDPDGNPDTSFLARIPADVSYTFQTLDKHGMSLNMAQTWHQVRPGEMRVDCGGCHAHSQKPTDFTLTFAAREDYQVFDLALKTPLLTTKKHDQSGKRWNVEDSTGLRFEKTGAVNVEFYRHIVPIFKKSCAACHSKDNDKPPANLVLNDLEMVKGRGGGGMFRSEPGGKIPATYAMLVRGVLDRYGRKHVADRWVTPQVSRYVRVYQSRRSLLAWKLLGSRNDGWSNEDFPTAKTPGDSAILELAGKSVDESDRRNMMLADVDFTGSIMPPPEAVRKGKVKPLTELDRRTVFRWIDLGCPIDLDCDPANPEKEGSGSGWMDDETRPTITVTQPRRGRNVQFNRILIGMHDYYTGLDKDSFTVTANFEINGHVHGANLAKHFKSLSDRRWELKLTQPITKLKTGTLTVIIRDKQGNETRLDRKFEVAPAPRTVPK